MRMRKNGTPSLWRTLMTILRLRDSSEALIAKRTVYSYSELQDVMSKKTLVILFRFVAFNSEIRIEDMQIAGIKGNIQSIRQITEEQ